MNLADRTLPSDARHRARRIRSPSSASRKLIAWCVVTAAALTVLGEAAHGQAAQDRTEDRLVAANQSAYREFSRICQRAQGESKFFGSAKEQGYLDQLSRPLASENLEALSRDEAWLASLAAQDAEPLIQLASDAIRLGQFDGAHSLTRMAEALVARSDLAAQFGELRKELMRITRSLESTAWLLEAEDRNCLLLNNAASCILPIAPEAVHRDQEPIQSAIIALERWIDTDPTDPEALWLFNLAHMLAGTYPDGVSAERRIPPERFSPPLQGTAPPLMLNLGPALGVDVRDLAGGAVSDDFDGDGFIDLVSSSWDPCSPLRAFRSDGKGGYEDVTAAWGLDGQLGGLNLMHADVDGDGRLDLLVLRGAWRGREGQVRNSLLLNRLEQSGRFDDVTYAAGLAYPAYPTQAAGFSDFDLDGDLDLYIGNESASSGVDFLAFDPGRRGFPSQLLRNDGLTNGVPVFRDVARQAGVQNFAFAKGVTWADIDNDGDTDLFVSNIGPNRLYINQGNGRFTEESSARGLAGDSRDFAAFFFDVDNDGDPDLFNADYSAPTRAVAASLVGVPVEVGSPRLYLNQDGLFTDASTDFGLNTPHLPMGANHGDLDGDGWEDLYLGTGLPDYTAIHPNAFYRNLGGQRFEDQTFASRLGHLQKGHGVAFADLDHDGDLDLFEQLGGAFPYDVYGNALYRNPTNDGDQGHRYLILELRGTESNSFAIGARVTLEVEEDGGSRQIVRTVTSGGSFGGSSFRLEIGLGQATALRALRVRWPRRSGPEGELPIQVYDPASFELDQAYRLVEGEAPTRLDLPVIRLGPRRPPSPADHNHAEHRNDGR